tara:strand:+ start:1111 stop:1500 length:390 start_codon:yes stop_codon:yes gene_type:complete
MEIIPDYDTQFQSIEAPAPVPVQRATQVTIEGGISFGQYNANNPGLDAMYNMVGNLLNTGATLYENMTNLGFKKAAFEAEERSRELKMQLEEQYMRSQLGYELLQDGYADLFQLGSGGYTGSIMMGGIQ